MNFFSRQIVNSYSGFAQVTAPLGERTNVTVGARYTHDKISGYGEQNYVLPGVGEISAAPPGVPNPFAEETKTNPFTYPRTFHPPCPVASQCGCASVRLRVCMRV